MALSGGGQWEIREVVSNTGASARACGDEAIRGGAALLRRSALPRRVGGVGPPYLSGRPRAVMPVRVVSHIPDIARQRRASRIHI